jgi:acyl-CoA reductase-like NAD-dependent aldehyde dehydrogenase
MFALFRSLAPAELGELFKKPLRNRTSSKSSLSLVANHPQSYSTTQTFKTLSNKQHTVEQWNSGQVCMANSRVYVQDTIAEKFVQLFKENFEKEVAIGDPHEAGTNHGPQADETQHKTVLRYLEMGKKSGDLVIGGAAPSDREGYYIQPTIFTNTAEDATIMKEEVFGPVVNINVFKTEEEVLEKANNTEYGLYAAVFTKNIDRALRFAKGLEAGTVGINTTSPQTGRDMPFGGYKASGTGREGEPNYSLSNYLETKSVIIKIV